MQWQSRILQRLEGQQRLRRVLSLVGRQLGQLCGRGVRLLATFAESQRVRVPMGRLRV